MMTSCERYSFSTAAPRKSPETPAQDDEHVPWHFRRMLLLLVGHRKYRILCKSLHELFTAGCRFWAFMGPDFWLALPPAWVMYCPRRKRATSNNAVEFLPDNSSECRRGWCGQHGEECLSCYQPEYISTQLRENDLIDVTWRQNNGHICGLSIKHGGNFSSEMWHI